MNRLSLQPKTALSCLPLSCSRRSHQFKPLHASQIDFQSRTVSIHLPHDSIVGGEKWDVMRCELSPHKCFCPHLIPDSPSLVLFTLFHLQWLVPIFPSHSLVSVSGFFISPWVVFLFLPLHSYLNLYCLMFPVIGLSSSPFLSLLSSVMYCDRRGWEAFGQWESTDISLFIHSSNLEVPFFFSSTADVILQQDSIFHRFFSLSPILILWFLAPWT